MFGLGKPEIAYLAACQLATRAQPSDRCAPLVLALMPHPGSQLSHDASTVANFGALQDRLQDGLFENPAASSLGRLAR